VISFNYVFIIIAPGLNKKGQNAYPDLVYAHLWYAGVGVQESTLAGVNILQQEPEQDQK